MPALSFPLTPAPRRPRRFIWQIAALILASTTVLMSQQPNTPPATKTTPEKPQPKPDESTTAAAALMQINHALEGLAAKVVIQVERPDGLTYLSFEME